MILVTVGTTPFDNLVEAADKLPISEDILIQTAKGQYTPRHHPHFDFLSDITELIERAEIIVSHGGAGNLFQMLSLGKRIVAVPNLQRTDPHQTDLVSELSKAGYLIACTDLRTLSEAIASVRTISLVPYNATPCRIPETIEQYLRSKWHC